MPVLALSRRVLAAIIASVPVLGYPLALFLFSEEGVVLRTDKGSYGRGEVVRVELVNLGLAPVYTGRDYRVEYYDGSRWVPSEELTPGFFTLELRVIQPWRSMEWSIPLNEAPPGKYRVVKEVWLESEKKLVLHAYFEVKG